MGLALNATVIILCVAAMSGCDRSDESRAANAVPDNSEYGVVTAPQIGHLPNQPNFDSQMNVTTATTASADKGSTAPRLGDKAATGTATSTAATTAPPAGGTVSAQTAATPAISAQAAATTTPATQ